MTRRNLLRAGAVVGVSARLGMAHGESGPSPRVIRITAKRFAYEPSEIALKIGESVIVEINSLDFVHGMNIPALKTRLDLFPGRVNRLEFTPQQAGVIEFVCDNFCGEGHEEMHGQFVVSA